MSDGKPQQVYLELHFFFSVRFLHVGTIRIFPNDTSGRLGLATLSHGKARAIMVSCAKGAVGARVVWSRRGDSCVRGVRVCRVVAWEGCWKVDCVRWC